MNSSSYKVVLCQFLTLLCDKMLAVAIIWHIVSKSGNDSLASYLSISLTPYILSMFIAPAIIRKFGAISVVMTSNAFRSALYGSALLAMIYDAHFINNHVLGVMAVISNMAASLFSPAALSLPYILVKEHYLQKMISILQTNASISGLIGAPIGVFAYNYLGLEGLFQFAMCIYGISALIQKTINLGKNPFKASNEEAKHQTVHSPFVFAKKYKVASRLIILYSFVTLLSAPLTLFIPGFTVDVFHSTSYGLSMLEACLAMGGITGGLFLTAFALTSFPPWKLIFISNLAGNLCYLGFALNHSLISGEFILFAFGFFSMIETVFVYKFMQTGVNTVDIPITMSIALFTAAVAAPLGIYMASATAKLLTIQSSAILFSMLSVLLSFAFFYALRESKST